MKGPYKGIESDKKRTMDVSQFGFWLFTSAFISQKPNVEPTFIALCGCMWKQKHSLPDLACVGKW